MTAEDLLFADDNMEVEQEGNSNEHIISEVESMGFERSRIEAIISDLIKTGKRVDQDSVMERLLDE